MPRPAINDYIFYKIVNVNNDIDLCYVGSTANWKHRVRAHRTNTHNENDRKYNIKLYKTIREYGGWDEFKMVEIGRAEQLTQRQAEQVEEEYRIEMNADMNGKRCFVTEEQKKEDKKQYAIDNAEHIKQYKIEKADKIKERNKRYRIENADKIREQAKQYRSKNADKIKQNYYDTKEKLKEKSSEKITCECGGCYTRYSKQRHFRTQKHQDFMVN
jgi:hypothetical protein